MLCPLCRGDQHDPAMVEYFLTENLLAHFSQILQQRSNRRGNVAMQARVCAALELEGRARRGWAAAGDACLTTPAVAVMQSPHVARPCRCPCPPPPLLLQVLQTLSILIQNLRTQQTVYYLFSNNHINDIVSMRFDFEDDEVLVGTRGSWAASGWQQAAVPPPHRLAPIPTLHRPCHRHAPCIAVLSSWLSLRRATTSTC